MSLGAFYDHLLNINKDFDTFYSDLFIKNQQWNNVFFINLTSIKKEITFLELREMADYMEEIYNYYIKETDCFKIKNRFYYIEYIHPSEFSNSLVYLGVFRHSLYISDLTRKLFKTSYNREDKDYAFYIVKFEEKYTLTDVTVL